MRFVCLELKRSCVETHADTNCGASQLKTFFYERKGELNFVRGEDQKKYRGRKDAVFPRSKAFFEVNLVSSTFLKPC